MISSLTIKNFQRHRRLFLKLSKTVTTIVGPTDAGKSAALRALSWVALSVPRGDKFRKHRTKRTSVTVNVDGHTITRHKGKANVYTLDGQRLAAFGNKVPDEVAAILNVDDLNFQTQLDRADGKGPTFWFSLSPGELSKALNKIVDLGVIDSTLKKVSDLTRAARAEQSVIYDRLDEARAERKRLKPVESAAADFAALERSQATLATSRTTLAALERLTSQARKLHSTRARLGRAAHEGIGVVGLGTRLAAVFRDTAELGVLVTRARKADVLASARVPPIGLLKRRARELRNVQSKRAALEELVDAARAALFNGEGSELQLLLVKKELGAFEVCPACDQRIPSSQSRVLMSTSRSRPRLPALRRRTGSRQ